MTHIFSHPHALFLMLLIPPAILLVVRAESVRNKMIRRLLSSELTAKLTSPQRKIERIFQTTCLLCATAFIILAQARPQWGTHPIAQQESGRDVLFILDVSQSMLARDQYPNRLEFAKNAILQCLDDLRSSRVGLIAFAGSTSIRCPLTKDFQFFQSTLRDLAPDSLPVGGTRLGDAINKAVEKIIGDEKPGTCDVIFMTDGESHTPINTNAISRLAKSRQDIIILGIGSDTVPATIPITDKKTHLPQLLKNNGKIVYTQQNSKRLKKIATMIPGALYINVGTHPIDLADIYKSRIHLSGKSVEGSPLERPIEQYWRFLLIAIGLICASYLPRHHRPKVSWLIPTTKSRQAKTALTILILLASPLISKGVGQRALFKKGLTAYHARNFKGAINNFSAAYAKKQAPETAYNLATAHYRAGDFPNALRNFALARNTTDNPTLAIDAQYNMGNTYYMLTFHTPNITRQNAIFNMQHAIASYQAVIQQNPNHKNATYNLKVAKEMLKHLQQSNTQQQKNQDANSDNNGNQNSQDNDSSSKSKSSSSNESDKQDQENISPPNLTPDDILKEENKNNLRRSRKTHANFGKVKINW